MDFKSMNQHEKYIHKSYLNSEVEASLSDARRAYMRRSIVFDDSYRPFTREPVGNFLVDLRRTMNEIVNLKSYNVKINGYPVGECYLSALNYLMELALPGQIRSPTMSTADVFWEVYRWQNEATARNPDYPPLVLDIKFWPRMPIDFTLAMMDASAPRVAGAQRFTEDEFLYNIKNSVPLLPPGLTRVNR